MVNKLLLLLDFYESLIGLQPIIVCSVEKPVLGVELFGPPTELQAFITLTERVSTSQARKDFGHAKYKDSCFSNSAFNLQIIISIH